MFAGSGCFYDRAIRIYLAEARMHTQIILTMALVGLISGCQHIPGTGVAKIPVRMIDDKHIEAIANKHRQVLCPEKMINKDTACTQPGMPRRGGWLEVMNQCDSTNPVYTDCRERRNIIIWEMLLVVNHNYQSYEGNFIAGNAKNNFYVGGLRTMLETIVVFNPSLPGAQYLSGAAALTGNLQSSASKEFYFEQMVFALVTQMRRDRSIVKGKIDAGLKRPYAAYPLSLALQDIDDLYRAGTVASAIGNIKAGVT